MKKHLNTLFVTTQGSYLAKDGMAVAVRFEKKTQLRIPLHNLDGIVCFGRVAASPSLMGACADSNVTLSFLSIEGRLRAIVTGFASGNVLLRRKQYRLADDPDQCVALARNVVLAKIANCRTVLLRAARDAVDEERKLKLQHAANRLSASIPGAQAVTTLDGLRGVEGDAATNYFSALNEMITGGDRLFQFVKRTRRPPLDPLNCMLSFVYTLLMHDIRSACEASGLDAAVGFFHQDRPGRPGLALDLMEEFRPWLADRTVLTLINRRQVNAGNFKTLENGAVQMDDNGRKRVLIAWQERKQDVFTHPFLNEKTTVGLLPHLQARLLSRFLRGDLDAYPPLLWR